MQVARPRIPDTEAGWLRHQCREYPKQSFMGKKYKIKLLRRVAWTTEVLWIVDYSGLAMAICVEAIRVHSLACCLRPITEIW